MCGLLVWGICTSHLPLLGYTSVTCWVQTLDPKVMAPESLSSPITRSREVIQPSGNQPTTPTCAAANVVPHFPTLTQLIWSARRHLSSLRRERRKELNHDTQQGRFFADFNQVSISQCNEKTHMFWGGSLFLNEHV